MKRVEIIVSPQGESKVETHGFTGSECQKASLFLKQALGRSTNERLKPDFYNQANNERTINNKL